MRAAPVFSGAHIQAQMQPRFNAPMASVGRQEGGCIQLGWTCQARGLHKAAGILCTNCTEPVSTPFGRGFQA